MDFWRDANATGLTIGYHKRLVLRFQYRSYQTDKFWLGLTINWFDGSGWQNLFSLSQGN